LLKNFRALANLAKESAFQWYVGSNSRKKIIPRRTIKPTDVRASDWTTDQIQKQTAIMKIERGTAANFWRGKQQNSVTIRHRNWASFNIFIFRALASVILPRVSNCGIARMTPAHLPLNFHSKYFTQRHSRICTHAICTTGSTFYHYTLYRSHRATNPRNHEVEYQCIARLNR